MLEGKLAIARFPSKKPKYEPIFLMFLLTMRLCFLEKESYQLLDFLLLVVGGKLKVTSFPFGISTCAYARRKASGRLLSFKHKIKES